MTLAANLLVLGHSIPVHAKFVVSGRCSCYIGSTHIGYFSVGSEVYGLQGLQTPSGFPSYTALLYCCPLFFSSLSFSSHLFSPASAYVILFFLYFLSIAMLSSGAGPLSFALRLQLATALVPVGLSVS